MVSAISAPAPEAAAAPRRGRRTAVTAAALTAALVVSLPLAVGLGQAAIAPGEVLRFLVAGATGGTIGAADLTAYTVVWEIRAPRVVLAALLGAGLALTGVTMQVLVRNALADPFVLGVSSGASVGAALVVTTGVFAGLGIWALSGAAFAGALLASALVWVAAGGRDLQPLRLVLVGVVMGLGFQAVMTLVVFLAPRGEAARAVLFWLLGSLGGARWDQLLPVATAVLLGWAWSLRQAGALDVLAMGEDDATALGVDVARLRRRLLLLASVVPGVLVAACGAVGFVGLVVPHVVRLVVGPGHRALLVLAPLVGALFCVWVDVASRVLVPPRELPLGVLTAAVGVPVFVWLLRRRGQDSTPGRAVR